MNTSTSSRRQSREVVIGRDTDTVPHIGSRFEASRELVLVEAVGIQQDGTLGSIDVFQKRQSQKGDWVAVEIRG